MARPLARIVPVGVGPQGHHEIALRLAVPRKHLEGTDIGAKRLGRLKPSDVETLIVQLRGQKLADSTVRQVYTVLRQALDIAVRDGLLARNPAAAVRRPGVARQEALPPGRGCCPVARGRPPAALLRRGAS